MTTDECYIKPNFVKNNYRRHKRDAELSDNNEDLVYDIPVKSASIMDTIKEHKLLIITFAIIILLLIFVIVWMIVKDDKKSIKDDTKPVSRLKKCIDPDPDPDPPAITKPDASPVIPKPVTPKVAKGAVRNKTKPIDGGVAPHELQNIISHDQIVNTVDDDELNRYVNIEPSKTEVVKKKINTIPNDSTNEFDDMSNYKPASE